MKRVMLEVRLGRGLTSLQALSQPCAMASSTADSSYRGGAGKMQHISHTPIFKMYQPKTLKTTNLLLGWRFINPTENSKLT